MNGTYKILIVEDDKGSMQFIKTVLASAAKSHTGLQMLQNRCRIYTAPSVAQATRIIAKQPLDIAFIDKNLGAESGVDLCKKLSDTIPCVLMSGEYSSLELDAIAENDAKEAGAFTTLSKPFELRTFYEKLISAVNQRELNRKVI